MRRTAPTGRRREVLGLRFGLAALACAMALALALPGPASADGKAYARGACSRLLDDQEALSVMGEDSFDSAVPPAFDEFQSGESHLTCGYGASTEVGTELRAHTMLLEWGETFHALSHSGLFLGFYASICYLNLKGCDEAKAALRAHDSREAFKFWALAFKEAGRIRFLDNGFRGDPALIWRLEHPPLENLSYAIVYDEEDRSGLLATCSELPPGSNEDVPDNQCAVQALRRAYHNQATGFLEHPPHKH